MTEKSSVLESKDTKGAVQLSPRRLKPVLSEKMSTPTKARDGDQTPNSVGADMKNMDELIQRLSRANRTGVYLPRRNPLPFPHNILP